MQTSTQIFLEVHQPIKNQIRAKQQDANSRFLDVTLLDEGTPVDLYDHDVFLYAIKPDGKKVFNYCPIINATLGNFKCELTDQLLATPGCIKAEFLVLGYDGIEVLKTYTFIIEVMPMLYCTSAIESTDEFDAITKALKDINAVRKLIRNISDRIGWPYPEDIPQTLFCWFRWLKIYLEQAFNNVNTNITNRFNSLQNLINTLIGAFNNPGSSTSTTLFGRLNYVVSMFTNWWTEARAARIDVNISSRASQASIDALAQTLGNSMDIYDTAGTYTWTKPSGVSVVHVVCVGGGGAGGGGTGAPAGAGGGGSGVIETGHYNLTGVSQVSVKVGEGGALPIWSYVNGGNGGSSGFGQYLSASGGSGGWGPYMSNNSSGGWGGSGGGGGSAAGYGMTAGAGGSGSPGASGTATNSAGGGSSRLYDNRYAAGGAGGVYKTWGSTYSAGGGGGGGGYGYKGGKGGDGRQGDGSVQTNPNEHQGEDCYKGGAGGGGGGGQGRGGRGGDGMVVISW